MCIRDSIYNAARAANTATKDQESDDLRVQLFQSDELEAMKGRCV